MNESYFLLSETSLSYWIWLPYNLSRVSKQWFGQQCRIGTHMDNLGPFSGEPKMRWFGVGYRGNMTFQLMPWSSLIMRAHFFHAVEFLGMPRNAFKKLVQKKKKVNTRKWLSNNLSFTTKPIEGNGKWLLRIILVSQILVKSGFHLYSSLLTSF